MAKRTAIPKKLETAVLIECGRRCCLCYGLDKDGELKQGQIAHLDDDPSNNVADNLAYLCTPHHAALHTRGNMTKGLTSGEIKLYRTRLHTAVAAGTVDDGGMPPPSTQFVTQAAGNSNVINAVGPVTYRAARGATRPSVAPASGTLGADADMRSYAEYLVKRYNEWAAKRRPARDIKRPFSHAVIRKNVEARFGVPATDIPGHRFGELVEYLQGRIDRTIWGRNNPDRNYRSFDEHRAKRNG